MLLIESHRVQFLAIALGAGLYQIGFHRLLAGLGGRDLRFGLVDSGKGRLNACVLKLDLTTVILDGCLRGFHRRTRLCHLGLKILVLKLKQELPFVHLLVIGNVDAANNAGHFRT